MKNSFHFWVKKPLKPDFGILQCENYQQRSASGKKRVSQIFIFFFFRSAVSQKNVQGALFQGFADLVNFSGQ